MHSDRHSNFLATRKSFAYTKTLSISSRPVPPRRFAPRVKFRKVQILQFCLLFALPLSADNPQPSPDTLRNLTLEQLSQIEVTTPVQRAGQSAIQTPAAIYVITGEDIRRSGATSIPEALRLAPGVEVARIDGSNWSIGIRGFGTQL